MSPDVSHTFPGQFNSIYDFSLPAEEEEQRNAHACLIPAGSPAAPHTQDAPPLQTDRISVSPEPALAASPARNHLYLGIS